MAEDDVISIQNQLVAKERAKRIAQENALKRDIRSQIAKGGGYNPDGDYPSTDYREFPKLIYRDGKPPVVVHSRKEEQELTGQKPEPAKPVTVDTNELAAVEQVSTKRKYTKRQAPAPLPQNLE